MVRKTNFGKLRDTLASPERTTDEKGPLSKYELVGANLWVDISTDMLR